jgi:hypothetical protein
MKRRLAVIGFVVLFASFVVGCATTQTYKASVYNSTQTIAEAYNASMGTFKDLQAAGQLTPEQYLEGRELFIEFYDYYQDAVDIIIAYEKGEAGQGAVEGALAKLKTWNSKIKEYLAEQIKKGGKS